MLVVVVPSLWVLRDCVDVGRPYVEVPCRKPRVRRCLVTWHVFFGCCSSASTTDGTLVLFEDKPKRLVWVEDVRVSGAVWTRSSVARQWDNEPLSAADLARVPADLAFPAPWDGKRVTPPKGWKPATPTMGNGGGTIK